MKTKHTPGPWNSGNSDLPVSMLSVHGQTDAKHTTICRLVPVNEIIANQALIVAAPDMLEALLGFQRAWDENRPVTNNEAVAILVAIAKATT